MSEIGKGCAAQWVFFLQRSFEFTVPDDYKHEEQLSRFSSLFAKDHKCYNNNRKEFLTDVDFCRATKRLKPGKKYGAKIFKINAKTISFEDCLIFLQKQKAIFVGAQGLSLIFQLKNDVLPRGIKIASLDKKEALYTRNRRRRIKSRMYYFPLIDFVADEEETYEFGWGFDMAFCGNFFNKGYGLLCVQELEDFY